MVLHGLMVFFFIVLLFPFRSSISIIVLVDIVNVLVLFQRICNRQAND